MRPDDENPVVCSEEVNRAADKARLHNRRVAVAGLGGAGGLYAHALAQAGIGALTIADGDAYELANFNRQVGACVSTLGRNKAETIAAQLRAAHENLQVRVIPSFLDETNIAAFLDGADLVVDAIDVFSVPAHRQLFREARARGLSVLFAAPLGFTAAALCVDADGMAADAYFDWHDGQSPFEQTVNLLLGTAPAALHLGQVDLSKVDLEGHCGPSNGGACMACAGLVVQEAARRLLNRPGRWTLPEYVQVDFFGRRQVRGRLRRGNCGWIQRLKKRWVLRAYRKARAAA